ncbi:MAG: hypothetical protein KFE23_01465, partial [Candidatus Baumannia cicadellinicola]|nr:hypothetical protein [Candidatus Baumannia cicadellinicola]
MKIPQKVPLPPKLGPLGAFFKIKNNFNRFREAKLWRKEIEKVWKSVIKTAVNTARVVRLTLYK